MADVRIRELGEPGDLGWVVAAHGELYAAEFGWDTSFEAMVAGVVADFAREGVTARQSGWIAELDGRRVGSVLCTSAPEEGTALLRTLLLHPDARGMRIGARLVDTCLDFARQAGYRRIRLWTVEGLTAARAIYLARGFELVAAAEPRRMFGVDLVGVDYARDLAGDA